MELGQNEFERLVFFEHARKTAEANYAENPVDVDVNDHCLLLFSIYFLFIIFFFFLLLSLSVAFDFQNLTRWGGALLELSQFQNGLDSITMVKEAISRLEEALKINPRKHDALWCLGNAHTSHAFLSTDNEMGKLYFTKATECFQRAVEEDPGNELYLKSLELTAKFSQAPDIQLELQRQVISQQATGGAPSASSTKVSKKKKNSDLKYDICGWLILAVGIVVWVGMVKSHVPPPSPN